MRLCVDAAVIGRILGWLTPSSIRGNGRVPAHEWHRPPASRRKKTCDTEISAEPVLTLCPESVSPPY